MYRTARPEMWSHRVKDLVHASYAEREKTEQLCARMQRRRSAFAVSVAFNKFHTMLPLVVGSSGSQSRPTILHSTQATNVPFYYYAHYDSLIIYADGSLNTSQKISIKYRVLKISDK